MVRVGLVACSRPFRGLFVVVFLASTSLSGCLAHRGHDIPFEEIARCSLPDGEGDSHPFLWHDDVHVARLDQAESQLRLFRQDPAISRLVSIGESADTFFSHRICGVEIAFFSPVEVGLLVTDCSRNARLTVFSGNEGGHVIWTGERTLYGGSDSGFGIFAVGNGTALLLFTATGKSVEIPLPGAAQGVGLVDESTCYVLLQDQTSVTIDLRERSLREDSHRLWRGCKTFAAVRGTLFLLVTSQLGRLSLVRVDTASAALGTDEQASSRLRLPSGDWVLAPTGGIAGLRNREDGTVLVGWPPKSPQELRRIKGLSCQEIALSDSESEGILCVENNELLVVRVAA